MPNQVPLTDGLATPPACGNDSGTPTAATAGSSDKQDTIDKWTAWQAAALRPRCYGHHLRQVCAVMTRVTPRTILFDATKT